MNLYDILLTHELVYSSIRTVSSRTYGIVDIRVNDMGQFIRFEDPLIQREYELQCKTYWNELLS